MTDARTTERRFQSTVSSHVGSTRLSGGDRPGPDDQPTTGHEPRPGPQEPHGCRDHMTEPVDRLASLPSRDYHKADVHRGPGCPARGCAMIGSQDVIIALVIGLVLFGSK